jgi:hypothetical protein
MHNHRSDCATMVAPAYSLPAGDEEFDAIRASFLARLTPQLSMLSDDADGQLLLAVSHRVAGTAGLLGLRDIAASARQLHCEVQRADQSAVSTSLQALRTVVLSASRSVASAASLSV